MLSQIAPAPAPSSAADLRAVLVVSHDAATVDAVLASVAAWLDASTDAALDRVAKHGQAYEAGWSWRGHSAARQLTAAVPAVPAVRIPSQRTAAA